MTTSQRVSSLLPILLIISPFVLFLALVIFPSFDPVLEAPVFHFYVVSYTSLVGMIVASYVVLGIGASGARSVLVGMGCVAMAALLSVHGIATPGILIPGFNQAVGWSTRLSLLVGSLFFAVALRDHSNDWDETFCRYRHFVWGGLLTLYALYVVLILTVPGPFAFLSSLQWVRTLIAVLATGLYALGAGRAWRLYQADGRRLMLVLTLALGWLALAQVIQYSATLWNLSWWLYHPLILAAFSTTMVALILEYQQVLVFDLTRYFAALSALVGLPLMAAAAEAVVRLSGQEGLRWPVAGLVGGMLLIIFAAQMAVVNHGAAILDQRAEELRSEKQWRTDFIHLIVHDLKTPLTAIFSNLEIISSGMLGAVSDEQLVRLRRIQRSGNNMLALVNNLLDVEQLETGKISLDRVAADIPRLLQEGVDAIAPLAEQHQVAVSVKVPSNAPPARVDVPLLRRVIQNLLDNAVKFSPVGGRVEVSMQVMPDELCITVIDEGPGIPVEERDRIFEKFGQVQGLERAGSGLGLTFCRLAVEAHGGNIRVENGSSGGAQFVVELPVTAS